MAWLRDLLKSSYTLQLEQEVARLRVENRAFLNSLLGTVGVPPVGVEETGKPVAAPRKRSWMQVLREREDGARKKVGLRGEQHSRDQRTAISDQESLD
jgi:hypothetical protein